MEEDLMMQFEVEFARVVRLYYSRMQAQLAEVGLYRGQPPIMALLHKRDGMSQKEMARALNLSPATMTVPVVTRVSQAQRTFSTLAGTPLGAM